MLGRLAHRHGLSVAATVFCLVVAIDASTALKFSMMPLYLAVILFSTWRHGARWGGVFLAASLLSALSIGVLLGHPFVTPVLFYIDVVARFVVYATMLWIVATARIAFDRTELLARSDGLTGLANRRALHERIEFEVDRQKRSHQAMTLAYIDCDNFKLVNDRYGHKAGDELLAKIAFTLSSNVRKIDLAARIGGDEFALLLPETDAREATRVIEKLRGALGDIPQARDKLIGFSIGVVVARNTPKSVDQFIDQADQLMFNVKRSGKNNVAQLVLDAPHDASGAPRASMDTVVANDVQ